MYCSQCGAKLEPSSAFCPKCGASKMRAEQTQSDDNIPLYHLPVTDKRKCDITVLQDKVVFSGKFYYLKDKEFCKNKKQTETAYLRNYLGMGYLSQRSYRKTLWFIVVGTVMELAKLALDKITELVDKANDYLKWIDRSITLPEWMNNTVNALAIICLILGIVLFFSEKKVIEISFTDKRICVPQKSMSKSEYNMLYQSIQNAKKMLSLIS
jgi:hypothetical protein